MEHVAPESGVALELEKAARPQAQLLRVDIERVIHIAPEIGASAAAAAHNSLGGREQINVQYDTLLCEIVPQPAPVAGEARSKPNIPAPGIGHVVWLRPGHIWGNQQDQRECTGPAETCAVLDRREHRAQMMRGQCAVHFSGCALVSRCSCLKPCWPSRSRHAYSRLRRVKLRSAEPLVAECCINTGLTKSKQRTVDLFAEWAVQRQHKGLLPSLKFGTDHFHPTL